ncbi:MAG TPA: hypothetical protein ENK18_06975 [Deltaproteobacteria bacterium]|nr:hypothetical protein [Deltaproteobacteria bacterium]
MVRSSIPPVLSLGAFVLLLGACGGPDLAQLEVEQRALEREVAVLRSNVATMRARMQAEDLIPSGPAGASTVGPRGGLAGELSFSVTRSGQLPELELPGEPERRSDTDCGWRFSAPWLEAISDLSLEKSGSGRSSPILLQLDGSNLSPHAMPPRFERSCSGAFRVQPKYIFFSPWSPDAVEGTWTLSVDEAIPVPRAIDGRGMYWIYPGTSLTFSFEGAWDESWGDFGLVFDARLLPVGTPDRPRLVPSGQASVSALGQTREGRENRLGLKIETPPSGSSWELVVATPGDGPWVLIETLFIGNEERSLVVSAEGS